MDAVVERLGPNARKLLDCWQGLPRREFVPERRAFDPMAIAAILPLVTILERADDDWRFRLVGSDVERRWGGRYAGRNYLDLDFVSGLAAEAMRREFTTLTGWPCGSWSRRNVAFHSGRRAVIETLRLPFRVGDGSIGQIISCSEELGEPAAATPDGPREIIQITEQQFVDIGAGAPDRGVLD